MRRFFCQCESTGRKAKTHSQTKESTMDAKKIAMTAAIALAAVFIARKIEPVNKIIFG